MFCLGYRRKWRNDWPAEWWKPATDSDHFPSANEEFFRWWFQTLAAHWRRRLIWWDTLLLVTASAGSFINSARSIRFAWCAVRLAPPGMQISVANYSSRASIDRAAACFYWRTDGIVAGRAVTPSSCSAVYIPCTPVRNYKWMPFNYIVLASTCKSNGPGVSKRERLRYFQSDLGSRLAVLIKVPPAPATACVLMAPSDIICISISHFADARPCRGPIRWQTFTQLILNNFPAVSYSS